MVRKQGNMEWWQLSLIGIGCTIGTGFFLGSSIAIKQAGAAVLWLFLFSAIGTYFVYETLAKLSIALMPRKHLAIGQVLVMGGCIV